MYVCARALKVDRQSQVSSMVQMQLCCLIKCTKMAFAKLIFECILTVIKNVKSKKEHSQYGNFADIRNLLAIFP